MSMYLIIFLMYLCLDYIQNNFSPDWTIYKKVMIISNLQFLAGFENSVFCYCGLLLHPRRIHVKIVFLFCRKFYNLYFGIGLKTVVFLEHILEKSILTII